MKKFLFAILLLLGSTAALTNAQQPQTDLDWYNCSIESDSIYGAEVNKAYELLKGKRIKKNPIVAIIGGGMDTEHEDLKHSIWKNRKEKNNGKDNDKNGLIGDKNGWNFLGGSDGTIMEYTMSEGDREFIRLKEKYGDYIYNQGKYYKIIDGKRTQVDAPDSGYTYYYNRIRRQVHCPNETKVPRKRQVYTERIRHLLR